MILIAYCVLHPLLNETKNLGLETKMNGLNICSLSRNY